jgi:hypothetical protein
MKNLKNTLVAVGLVAVLGLGTVSASAGLLISDRGATPAKCTVKSSVLQQLSGVIAGGLNGLLISDLNGIIIIDTPSPECTNGNGLLISDRDGIIIID